MVEARNPENIAERWGAKKNYILQIELWAMLTTLKTLPNAPKGKSLRVIMFQDNQAAWAAVCKGGCREKSANNLVIEIWKLAASKRIALWVEWIPSNSNPADLPSRWPLLSASERSEGLNTLREWGFSTEVTVRRIKKNH